MQGNVLGGILRDLDRRTRVSTRPVGGGGPVPPVEGPRGPRGPAGPPGAPGGAATVLTTGEDGAALWEFPEPFDGVPVLGAVAVDPVPGGGDPVTVTVESVDAVRAVLRVWWLRPRPHSGLIAPAGGVQVHVTARSG
ncbi:hypothetical protein [Streptomyces anulatus]|uniref:hypothetical protein n=1 Tax=Streptomyces anulatus TaxID=1892 RepID=UPI003449CDED